MSREVMSSSSGQAAAARASMSQPFGNGKLHGPQASQAARDRTVQPAAGQAPAAAAQPAHSPPGQPIGNRKSLPPSSLAVARTAVPGSSAAIAGRGSGTP
jgi:hypothetical protein